MKLYFFLLLMLLAACEQEPATLSGPFIVRDGVRDGVRFDQKTEQPVAGVWVREAELWRYESPYKAGRLNGVERVFLKKNGQLGRKTSYKDGMLHGLSESFDYDTGHLEQSTEWFENKRHGVHRRFNTYQELVEEGRYVNGKREGYWLDSEPCCSLTMRDGKIVRDSGTGHYLNGERVDEAVTTSD